jgi:signal transduction protein with GAF and PtsI domain
LCHPAADDETAQEDRTVATAANDLPPALAAALTDAVRSTAGLFGAAACSVALVDPDAGTMRFVASHGEGERRIVGVEVPVSRGIAGWVVTSGTALAVADVQADQRFARDVAESTGYVPSTILAAPLHGDEEPLGVLSVLDPTRRERDLDLLGALGVLLSGTVSQTAGARSELSDAAAAVAALGRDSEALGAALLRTLADHGSGHRTRLPR